MEPAVAGWHEAVAVGRGDQCVRLVPELKARVAVAMAAQQAVHFIGMPEGALALAEIVVYLAAAPKSNALYVAYGEAAAEALEFPVQSTSIPGVAQRTGATTYYIEILPASRRELAGRAQPGEVGHGLEVPDDDAWPHAKWNMTHAGSSRKLLHRNRCQFNRKRNSAPTL